MCIHSMNDDSRSMNRNGMIRENFQHCLLKYQLFNWLSLHDRSTDSLAEGHLPG